VLLAMQRAGKSRSFAGATVVDPSDVG